MHDIAQSAIMRIAAEGCQGTGRASGESDASLPRRGKPSSESDEELDTKRIGLALPAILKGPDGEGGDGKHHDRLNAFLLKQTPARTNLRIGTQAHSLSHEGLRYFGLMEVRSAESSDDYCWVLGLRNSHDKTFPAGIVAGASVFACDNLSFSGEVKFARKHTRFIVRDLPQITERVIGQLMAKWHDQDKRIAAYKQSDIADAAAHDLVIRATDVGVCSNRLIPSVLHEWREPRHDAFEPRNVWSLFNAFTESLKDGNLAELPKRTEALHGLVDTHVGLGLN